MKNFTIFATIFLMATSSIRAQGTAADAPAVPKEGPDRVVAISDGKSITARRATEMLSHVAPQVRTESARLGKLPELLQQIYMQHQIAAEAAKLHLDRQPPWSTKLGQAAPPSGPNVPLPVLMQWNNTREHILWAAYFSQAQTPEARKALLAQKREQYKIQVQDADFFKSAP